MESNGTYWQHLYSALIAVGFQIILWKIYQKHQGRKEGCKRSAVDPKASYPRVITIRTKPKLTDYNYSNSYAHIQTLNKITKNKKNLLKKRKSIGIGYE